MIEYLYREGQQSCESEPLKVKLDGRACGEIRKVKGGFQYFPEGHTIGGEIFPSLTLAQQSLQGE